MSVAETDSHHSLLRHGEGSEAVQCVDMLAAGPGDPSLIPGTCWKGRTDSCKLFSDLCMCTVYVCSDMYTME